MNAAERNGSERETEVVAKPTRRRFPLEYKRKIVRWKHRAERAESLVEIQKNVAALLGTPFANEPS